MLFSSRQLFCEEYYCMQVLLPREHRELSAACAAGVQRGRLEEALDELKGAMAMQGLAGDLSGRPKNLWGVFSKMRAKKYDLDQVYDARALRIVAGSKAECYGILRLVRPCLLCPTVALFVHGLGAGLQHWHYSRDARCHTVLCIEEGPLHCCTPFNAVLQHHASCSLSHSC